MGRLLDGLAKYHEAHPWRFVLWVDLCGVLFLLVLAAVAP